MRNERALFIEAVQSAQVMVRFRGDRSRVENRGIYPLDALAVSWHLKAAGGANPLINFDASKRDYDIQAIIGVIEMYRRDSGRAIVRLLKEFQVPKKIRPSKLTMLARNSRHRAWKQRYDLGKLYEALTD